MFLCLSLFITVSLYFVILRVLTIRPFFYTHYRKLQLFENSTEASNSVADYIIEKINKFKPTERKPFVLGLPTGSSPEKVYARLVEQYKNGKVDFTNIVSFNMDEYYGLEATHPQSYHYFMYHHLFNHVNFKSENINILNGLASDWEKECHDYEAKIKKYGRIHLFLGGLGPEGHIAFNEAGSPRYSITRKVTLVESTIKANSRFFNNDLSKVPKYALSVGISTIIDNSDEIIIVVYGKSKRYALRKTVSSPETADFPSTYLQDHPDTTIYADFEAIEGFEKSKL